MKRGDQREPIFRDDEDRQKFLSNMNPRITRRRFLHTGLLGSAGAALVWPAFRAGAQAAKPGDGVCVTLCNHWSYTGIGWQLGIESDVLSATDAMGMADRPPGVKTCLELDARAYELMAERFPEVAERLKQYLAAGKVELIGGAYAQPMGTTIGGESNIRQVVYGRETIRQALDYEVATFLEEEEFTHPQLPQILVGAGYKYASLAQCDTWGRAGIPVIELNVLWWKGKDGTSIRSTPKNSLFGWAPDVKVLEGSPAFAKLKALGKPLIFTWAEFGWESPETPSYLSAPEGYKQLAEKSPVEFVTLKEYMDRYGAEPKETVYLDMDSWHKSLTWGIGGDQIRILDRKVEALLLAAERFDAVASSFGLSPKPGLLKQAWKDLLIAQSHDVGLCEYSRWQGDRMAPLDRIEDLHNFTWGALGYNHLDAAQAQGQRVLEASLGHIAARIGSAADKQGSLAVTVFNPSGWPRTGLVATGRIYPIREKASGMVVRDKTGRAVPSQMLKREEDGQGNLVVADVAFVAEQVPSVGYDTYYLELTREPAPPGRTDLRIDEPALELENECLKVKLDAATGAIASLIDKRDGRQLLRPAGGAFPVFKGRPNASYPLRTIFDPHNAQSTAYYDSAKSKAEIQWLEKGPVRAVVRAQHSLPLLKFETRVSLCSRAPWVEVLSRVLAEVPPAVDAVPADIKEGYWLSLVPAFEPATVLRDFPLAIEPTVHRDFHALTLVDFLAEDYGLLLLHAGTQYFKRGGDGAIANLIMREWESHWTGEYGWPRYAEYRHGLFPHPAGLTHAQRTRAAAEFTQGLIPVVGPPQPGVLPRQKSFISVPSDHVQLSAFRKKERPGFELRLAEASGLEGPVSVELGFPFSAAWETNLLGEKLREVSRDNGRLSFHIKPWEIRNFQLLFA